MPTFTRTMTLHRFRSEFGGAFVPLTDRSRPGPVNRGLSIISDHVNGKCFADGRL